MIRALVVLAFVIGFYPALDYILFMGFKKSTILRIPYDIAFFPFVIFMAGMIGHFAVDIWRDIRLIAGKPEEEV